MELACSSCSSLRLSTHQRFPRKVKIIPTSPFCKASNLLLKSSKNLSSSHIGTSLSSTLSYNHISIRACSQVGTAGSEPVLDKFSFKDALGRFLSSHTIRVTALGSISLVSRALMENPNLIRESLVLKALSGIVALLCANGYVVGINQIFDIGIDKVNKAWFLVLLLAAAGVLIVGTNFSPFISSLYCFGLFLGTIYSVPPFRMKRFSIVALLIIATVRGFLLNFGVYFATTDALGLSFKWSSPVAFLTTFVTFFALVIAITKGLPDVEGDSKSQISTLSTKLGARNIASIGFWLLFINYIGAIGAGIGKPQAFKSSVMIPVHAILGLCLVYQAWLLAKANYTKEAMSEYYKFICNLFYAQYLIFPFI